MILTRIAKTRQGRYALFDETDMFLFSVDEETLVRRHLAEGNHFTVQEMENLREESDLHKAKHKALDYLSFRAHGQEELYQKLCVKFDPHTSAAAIAAVQGMGLLDDEAYAMARARGLLAKKKSARDIRMQLLCKGIDRDLVSQVLEALAPEDEDACFALLQKSYLRKLEAGETQKVIAAMARRGFAYKDIKEAIAKCGEEAPEVDWDGEE